MIELHTEKIGNLLCVVSWHPMGPYDGEYRWTAYEAIATDHGITRGSAVLKDCDKSAGYESEADAKKWMQHEVTGYLEDLKFAD